MLGEVRVTSLDSGVLVFVSGRVLWRARCGWLRAVLYKKAELLAEAPSVVQVLQCLESVRIFGVIKKQKVQLASWTHNFRRFLFKGEKF